MSKFNFISRSLISQQQRMIELEGKKVETAQGKMLTRIKLHNQLAKLGTIGVSGAIAVGLSFLVVVLGNINQQKNQEIYRNEILGKLTSLRATLESDLNLTLFINRGLVAYVKVHNGIDAEMFWELAKELYQESPNIRNLGIAPNNIITNVYPLEGNEDALGLNYLKNPEQKEAVLRAMQTKTTVLAGPLPLVQGGNGIISRTPIFIPAIPKQGWNKIGQPSPLFLILGFSLAIIFGILVYTNLSNQIKLREMAWCDPLTNIPNRRFFSQCFISTLEHSKRHQRCGAVMVLDLDGFKAINDNYGHNIGDLALKEIVQRLLTALRASDLIARIGGDEFWVLLSEINHAQDVIAVAQRIIRSVDQPIIVGKYLIEIGVSIGIAIFPEHGWDEHRLIELADLALYRVKSQGKNNFEFAC